MIGNVGRFVQGALSVGVLASATAFAPMAQAHIDVDRSGTHLSRHGDAAIKQAPCGQTGGTRGDNVYTYKPGSTIEIKLNEFVRHPGYFRIAFDDNGDDGFETPATISGVNGDCAGDPKCGAGMDDFCNNDTVLYDNIAPHSESFVSPAKEWTWKVKLPNVECDNCTLQIIQVMEDLNIHGAPYPADDIYYQCIDLILSNEASEEGVEAGPFGGEAMDCKAGEPMGGAGGMGGSGGMSATGGTGGMGTGGMTATGGAGGMSATGGADGAGTTGGTGGAAGMMAMTGGVGGEAGAVVSGGAGGAGGTVGGTGAPSSGSSDDGGGCSVSNAPGVMSALWPLGLALLLLRRRCA